MAVSLSIKNVPDPVLARLRRRARRNNRSLQGELPAILDDVLLARRLTVDDVYRRVRALGLRTDSDSASVLRQERDAR
ncbi:MAG: hypothetical protein QME96_13765 [Myxococcota bacterium]|nr:hypothetical protein [Myxococcota bacterium]